MIGLVLEKWLAFTRAKLMSGRELTAVVLCLCALFSASGVHAQTSDDAPLRIELGVENQSISVTLHNDGLIPVAILTWGTPFADELGADVLQIRDIQVLPALNYELLYDGFLLKRGEPQAGNLLTVAAGQSVTSRVTPADHYAIDVASTYQVQYRGEIQYTTAIDSLNDQSQSIRTLLQFVSPPSNTVEIRLDVPPEIRAAVLPTFASCSASEQTILQSALQSAETLARDASVALDSLAIGQRSNSPRYKQWFGTYSDTRFNIVKAGFNNLRLVLENNTIDFVCGCTREIAYASVSRSRPLEINLCPRFWTAPEIGTDSRAGTLIHELSHFNEIIGTEDFRYGQFDVSVLATVNPDQSVFNADSYEYFAENTPSIPIAGSDSGNEVAVLPLDIEQSGALSTQQSKYFSVSGARSIELTSINGDADLFILRTADDQGYFCESTTTASVDVCSVASLPTAIVRVYAHSASEYRVLARSGLVTVQGGNSGTDDNGGSMSIVFLFAIAILARGRRTLRMSSIRFAQRREQNRRLQSGCVRRW